MTNYSNESQSSNFNRRRMLATTAVVGAATTMEGLQLRAAGQGSSRKFTMDLCPGRIGVKVSQEEAIELAAKFGFESVEPMGSTGKLAADGRKKIVELLKSKKLKWGAAGLPVDFRGDQSKFLEGLKALPNICLSLADCGVDRIGTWLMPAHDELTYRANFDQHVRRLQACARVLADYDIRLGLEYVGPRTSWSSKRFAFIHTMAETKELIEAIDLPNMGLVLDSWHWYTAEEKLQDLESLSASDVVAVDLNDAPSGIAVEEQIDNRRELPAATGVISVAEFLRALVAMDYDGPIRAEPFNKVLNAMENAPAVEATAKAMKNAFATI